MAATMAMNQIPRHESRQKSACESSAFAIDNELVTLLVTPRNLI